MNPTHELDPMLFSWCVALAAAYAAFDLGGRLSSFDGGRRWLWLLAGACATGTGIWAAHITGMQAQGLAPDAGFNSGLGLLSWLAASTAALLGLELISRPEWDTAGLAGGGLSIGLGLVAAHCLGLAALRPGLALHYDLPMLGAAVLLAAALSAAGVLAGFSLRRLPERQLLPGKGCGVLLTGAGLSAMRHTVMAAVQVPAAAPGNDPAADWLGPSLALFTVAFIAAVMLLSMFDAQRQEARWQERERVLAARFRRRLAGG